MAKTWTYVPGQNGTWFVILPLSDLVEIQKDRKAWIDSSWAHHNAVEWED